MESRWKRRGPALLVAIALASSSLAPGLARADVTGPAKWDLDAARASFQEGLELEKAGDYAGALAKFEETAEVKTTPQVLFHLAMCDEKLGHWVRALERYEAAAKQANEGGTAPEVAKAAPGLADALRPRIPKLSVTVVGELEADAIAIDGASFAPDDARSIPLDPGKHVVVATHEDRKIQKEVSLKEGESRTLEITIPPPNEGPLYTDPAELPREKHVLVDEDPGRGRRTAGWILSGVGVASLATAGAFLLVRQSAMNDLENACGPDLACPASAEGALDRAHTFTTLSRVAVGVSAVTLITGLVLIATGGHKKEAESTAKLSPWAPQGSLGFGLEGVF